MSISVLILEDDEKLCNDFEKCINSRNDISLVAKTSSSDTALEIVTTHLPNAIIADIELHNGKGSRSNFSKRIKRY